MQTKCKKSLLLIWFKLRFFQEKLFLRIFNQFTENCEIIFI